MKKLIAIMLLVVGIILILAAFALAAVSAADKNIIGGAGMHILIFTFLYENSGLYFIIAFFGASSVLASIILKFINKKY